nr:AAA family ATPase [uncultured Agathobaculum sp.]
MNIEIKCMDISNFKGIRKLHLDFHNGVNTIYGDNATGKTTVYDALIWLLFGKDSHGSSSFSIKPVGAAPGVTPEVTATLLVNGETISLRKTLRERWEKHRGSAEARFAGNTTDYFVDDVPRKESEYKRIIAGYIDENQFKLLTNVYAFARDLHWKDRRKLLAEICGLPDDASLLSSAPQFAELAEAVGRRTVDDYKAALMAQRKGANASLNTLPVRIDECERMVRELSGLPFEQARRTAEALQNDRARVQTDLAKLDGDALIVQAENERDALNNQLRELENENRAHRDSQYVPVEDETADLMHADEQAQEALDQAKRIQSDLQQRITGGNARLDDYRARWRAIDKEQFTGGTCPTCGQTLPAAELEAAKKRFETSKQDRKNGLLEDSKLLKADIASMQTRLQEVETSLSGLQAAADQAARALADYTPPAAPVIEDLPDYVRRKDALNRSLDDCNRRIERLRTDKQAERDRLESEYKTITSRILENDATLAKEQTLADTRRRVTELQAEQRRAAAEVEEMDRMIELCEEFARFRVQSVEQSVNSKFRLARFRLFTEQINGGLADCCDVVVDGVPYADLNSAMQINVGLDIIETLSQHYDRRVPLFIDNAESVTKLQEISAQVVRLAVSAEDKELRLE